MSYAPFNYKSTSSTRSHTHPGSASGVDTECPKGRERVLKCRYRDGKQDGSGS
jgi:hypothetical protein